jgi:hypothetical protein
MRATRGRKAVAERSLISMPQPGLHRRDGWCVSRLHGEGLFRMSNSGYFCKAGQLALCSLSVDDGEDRGNVPALLYLSDRVFTTCHRGRQDSEIPLSFRSSFSERPCLDEPWRSID